MFPNQNHSALNMLIAFAYFNDDDRDSSISTCTALEPKQVKMTVQRIFSALPPRACFALMNYGHASTPIHLWMEDLGWVVSLIFFVLRFFFQPISWLCGASWGRWWGVSLPRVRQSKRCALQLSGGHLHPQCGSASAVLLVSVSLSCCSDFSCRTLCMNLAEHRLSGEALCKYLHELKCVWLWAVVSEQESWTFKPVAHDHVSFPVYCFGFTCHREGWS